MEITEDHLQQVFEDIETRAIKSGKKDLEYQAVVSTAWSMRTKLLSILRAKSEEDLNLSLAIAKDCVRTLEERNGDISSLKYKCGHHMRPAIIKTTADTLATYFEWKNDVEGLCIECWIEKKRKKEKERGR